MYMRGFFLRTESLIMQIDPKSNSIQDNYKLLTNLVIPRPIAWVTSRSEKNVINLAPFSFFNAVGSDPMYLVIGVGRATDGGKKDTARNIESAGEFVVNLVTEDLIDAMNISAADFPADESELTAAGLHGAASAIVSVPRVAESQVSLECKLHSAQQLGASTLIIGQIVMFHIADHLVGPRSHINNFTPIARLGTPSMYARTADRFDLPRLSYEQAKTAKR
jgi:flavin reductase (DIM6/NTAB) family NADH-FMN oxidoreductase RutF